MTLVGANQFDKDQLLRFLLYHLSQEQREHLRQELPGAYRRIYDAACPARLIPLPECPKVAP